MGKDQLDPAQVAQPTAEEDKNEVEPTDSLGVVAPVLTASPDQTAPTSSDPAEPAAPSPSSTKPNPSSLSKTEPAASSSTPAEPSPSTSTPTEPAPAPTTTQHPPASSSQPHITPLLSSRPAPPSPASSRPSSTVISPDPSCLSLVAAASGSGNDGGRDRSLSASSRGAGVAGGRRVSTGSSGARASLRPRPRSTLGTSVSLPETDDVAAEELATNEGPAEAAEAVPDSLPESEAAQGDVQTTAQEIVVVIRDFAFVASDERYHGRGPPIEKPDRASGGGFSWSWRGGQGGDDESGSGGEGSKKSWGGFGLLGGWRGFGRRGESSGSGAGEDESGEGDGSGFIGSQNDADVDADPENYFSSPEDSEMEDDSSPNSNSNSNSGTTSRTTYEYTILPPQANPEGLYRAAYAFEAVSGNELHLAEGDLLEISGRGKGDPGWVIARKMRVVAGRVERVEENEGGGKVGLVPEGYLERIEVIGV